MLLEPFTKLYVHLVWATWDRQPLITPGLERALYACIQAECRSLRAEVIAIGGMEDHVHLLVRVPPAVSISKLVQQVKGASSHLATHQFSGAEGFKWQGRYGAFSVSAAEVPRITDYIGDQKRHHRDLNVDAVWEMVGE